MINKKTNQHLAISMFIISLLGCGSGGGDSGSANAADLYPNISVSSASISMNSNTNCSGTSSSFRTTDFIVGSPNSISDAKLKEIARISQNAFNTDASRFNWNMVSEFDVDSSSPLEVCVLSSEGSNGAGDYYGFTIGPDSSGTALDELIKHEIKHTYQSRFVGEMGLGHSHVWYNEGVAVRLTTNDSYNASMLNTFNSQISWAPTQITADSVQDAVQILLTPAYYEYPAYNASVSYLLDQGVSVVDLWEVFKTINVIEQSCRADHQTAIDNGETVVAINDLYTSCTGYSDVYASGATTWNGQIISDTLQTPGVSSSQPGVSKFVAAFNYVMNSYGISYESIDSISEFQATVMSNM
ncbi:hypothetical protein [Vibrio atlanticus]|uniref:hypothetical protein n=1 Tax=Vibrio atlanticus TaxID=693153 RepID=UPI0021C2C4FE|nr:hypothetical protein [Vibrio atlanticus]